MKKYIVVIFILICQNAFCQEYYFDHFLQYKKSQGTIDVFMLNSSNQDYVFYCFNKNDELQGRIVDHKRNIEHYYAMKNINNSIEFKYLYSKKIEADKPIICDNVKKENFEVKTEVTDSLNQSYQIIEYTNKKKKRIYQDGSVSLKKIDAKYLPFIVCGYFSHFSKCIDDIVSFPKGYIPVNIKITYFNNVEEIIELIQNKKINTVLTLKPEDIKYN